MNMISDKELIILLGKIRDGFYNRAFELAIMKDKHKLKTSEDVISTINNIGHSFQYVIDDLLGIKTREKL